MTADRRRRRSAVLSFVAASTTLVVFASFAVTTSSSIRAWLVFIAVPAVAMSVAAGVQYLRTAYTGAGAAAVAVYWTLVLLNFRAGPAYVPGAVLQTIAWFVSRPRRDGRHGPGPVRDGSEEGSRP